MPITRSAVSDEVGSREPQLKVIEQNLADGQVPTAQLPRILQVLRTMVRDLPLQRPARRRRLLRLPGRGASCGRRCRSISSPRRKQPDAEAAKKRLLYIHMSGASARRAVEAGVVMESADADLGAILGIGFPASTGGTLSFIDTLGLPAFVVECERPAAQYGPRFQPDWLRAKARRGETFHPPLSAAA